MINIMLEPNNKSKVEEIVTYLTEHQLNHATDFMIEIGNFTYVESNGRHAACDPSLINGVFKILENVMH